MTHWFVGKFDAQVPSFLEDAKRILIPTQVLRPKTVVLVTKGDEGWWIQGIIYKDLPLLSGVRVITHSFEEATYLSDSLPLDNEYLALDIVMNHCAACTSTSSLERGVALEQRIQYLQIHHRVDFTKHTSILGAWRWRDLRRIRKDWGSFELLSTNQWARSVAEQPWQEARMAYDLRPLYGAVLDIDKAYASILEQCAFPKPGIPWAQVSPGTRSLHALHCITWRPTTSIGRFFHPYRYTLQTKSAHPALALDDSISLWVLDNELTWLTQYGVITQYHQTVIPDCSPHPLSGTIRYLKDTLATVQNPAERALYKQHLVSTHTWTWQPRAEYISLDDPQHILKRYIEDFSSRPFAGQAHILWQTESDIGATLSMPDNTQSGSYVPVAWARLQLRSIMCRLVTALVESNVEIAYVNIDGIHVRAQDKAHLEYAFNVAQSCTDLSLRIDKTFDTGFWFSPGHYALCSDNVWAYTNLPENITGAKWPGWARSIGPLDARPKIGFWRRPNQISAWNQLDSVTPHAQRLFRKLVQTHLHR